MFNLLKYAAEGKFTVIAVEKPFAATSAQPGSAQNCSLGFNADFTAESWHRALQTALADARNATWVDHSRTLVFGSSEGAVMAAVLAASDPSITDVIAFSGSGTTQLFDFVAQAYRSCFDVAACLNEIQANVTAIMADPHSSTSFAWGHPYKRWNSFFSIDAGELLLKSKARVYIAMGTADDAVPAISQELAVAKLVLGRRDVTVRRVVNGTHSLNQREARNWDDLDREQRTALEWFNRVK
jgi:predicted esterase